MAARDLAKELSFDAIDMEWGWDGTELWILQARPVAGMEPLPPRMRQGRWRPDLEHNPGPVSPVHADLVNHLEIPAAVWNGWVFYRDDGHLPARDEDTLRRLMPERGELEEVLARFGDFAGYYLGTSGAGHRGVANPEDTPALPSAWDVAAPTVGELVGQGREDVSRTLAVFAGTDDVLFARALLVVRQAMEERVRRWYPTRNIPLALWPLAALLERISDAELDAMVSRRARTWRWWHGSVPPPEVRAGVPSWELTSTASARWAVHGDATGTVHFLGSGSVPEPPWIGVAYAITPGLAIEAMDAAGLVLGSPNVLSHGVILARELGIPTIVGYEAWRTLREGQRVSLRSLVHDSRP